MTNDRRYFLGAGFFIAIALSVLLAAGCSKPEDTASSPSGPPGGQMGGGPGGPPGGQMRGGPGGPPGGGMRGGGPVAENATGAEIYQAKCGCHGPEGKGGRAPVLTSLSGRSDSDLYKVIHDGRNKMPAFGAQLSEAQIKKVVTYVKQLKSGT